MNFQYSVYGIIPLISAFVVLCISIYCYRKRSLRLHLYTSLLGISVFLWCFGLAMESFSTEMWANIFWNKISYIGAAIAPIIWIILVLEYGKCEKYLKFQYFGLLMVLPLIIIILAFTNEWHGLLWSGFIQISNQSETLLIYEHGPFFWVNVIYSSTIILTGIVFLIKLFITSSKIYRLQIFVLMLSGLIPLISSIVYIIFPFPELDLSSFGLTIAVILIAISMSKFHFLDIIPIAHAVLFKSMVNGVLVFDAEDRLIEVNSAANLIGINHKDIGKNVIDVLSNFEDLKDFYNESGSETEIFLENPFNYWVQVQIAPIYDENVFRGRLLIVQDIDNRKKIEKELKKSLKEKDLMMKEIHHRTKNNLMVIQSLLQLQSRYIKDENALNIFKDSENRAKSMALIHQRLYQSRDLKKIEFGDYTKTLALDLFRSYAADPARIKLNVQVDNAMLDINTAIPLGLIFNELVSNSLKYAFPEGRTGQLTVKFYIEGSEYNLVINDDGIGLPDGFDYKKSDSLGLMLVYSLSDQIGAKIELNVNDGVRFKISFKEQY